MAKLCTMEIALYLQDGMLTPVGVQVLDGREVVADVTLEMIERIHKELTEMREIREEFEEYFKR